MVPCARNRTSETRSHQHFVTRQTLFSMSWRRTTFEREKEAVGPCGKWLMTMPSDHTSSSCPVTLRQNVITEHTWRTWLATGLVHHHHIRKAAATACSNQLHGAGEVRTRRSQACEGGNPQTHLLHLVCPAIYALGVGEQQFHLLKGERSSGSQCRR